MKTTLKPTRRAVMKIALKTGLIRKCPHHWVYLRSNEADALEHAIRLGNYLISHMSRSVACFKGDRKRMISELLQCRDDAPQYCPQCESLGEQDHQTPDFPLLRQH